MQNDIKNTTINLDYLKSLKGEQSIYNKNIKDALQLLADLDEKSLELFGLSESANFGVNYACKIHGLIETYKTRFEQVLHRLEDIEHENDDDEKFCLETGELVTEKYTTYKERMIDGKCGSLDNAKLKQELFCGYYLKDIDEVLDAQIS